MLYERPQNRMRVDVLQTNMHNYPKEQFRCFFPEVEETFHSISQRAVDVTGLPKTHEFP